MLRAGGEYAGGWHRGKAQVFPRLTALSPTAHPHHSAVRYPIRSRPLQGAGETSPLPPYGFKSCRQLFARRRPAINEKPIAEALRLVRRQRPVAEGGNVWVD